MPPRAWRGEQIYVLVAGLAAATLFLMSFLQWRENIRQQRAKRSACHTGGAVYFRGSEYRTRRLTDSRMAVAPGILGTAQAIKPGCGARTIEVRALRVTPPDAAVGVAGSRRRLLVRSGVCTEARNERALASCLKARGRAAAL